jgi:aryl-alcohol dehydrogenase-like predicted oxidoreductase
VLDAFVAAGFNLIDTADVYSIFVPGHVGGESESMIGRWLERRGRRDDVVIATKVGMQMGPGEKGLSRPYILKSVDRSLHRLKTDHIDLYQAHIDDKGTALEETLGAFADLIAAGKVRAIGASNYEADRLAAALAVSKSQNLPRFETLQPWYNLYDRVSFEGALADVCHREKLGVIPSFYDATPAQVSLAWLRSHGVTAPIASATSAAQLEELARFVDIELGRDAVAKLDDASEGGSPPPAW